MGLGDMFHSKKKDEVEVQEDEYLSDDSGTLAEKVDIGSSKTLVLYRNMDIRDNKVVKDEQGNTIYFCELHHTHMSKFLILREGGKEGTEVGRASSNIWMTKMEFDFGERPGQSFKSEKKHWRYDWLLPNGRMLVWKSTRQNDIDGKDRSRSRCNYKLVDSETNEVIAMFLSTRAQWKTLGKVVVRQKYADEIGPEFEKGLLMGLIALLQILQIYLSNSVAASNSAGAAAAISG